MTNAEILEALANLIVEVMPGVDRAALVETTDLYQLGLDSATAVGLMLAIEDRFAVTFTESLLSDKTFQTPAALMRAVQGLLGGASS
jgi:acyl carrier protein